MATMIQMKNENNRYVPTEILTDILLQLPLKSLGRCQCVCKEWCTLIRDREFAHSLRERTRSRYVNVYEGEEIFIHHLDGMVLEQVVTTKSFTYYGLVISEWREYRIRNPTTNYILDIPDPYHRWFCKSMSMFYQPRTKDYKLACTISDNYKELRCLVLRIGTDFMWRNLTWTPNSKLITSIATQVVYFLICSSEIACLEIEPEEFFHVGKFPPSLLENSSQAVPFNWGKKKLALSYLMQSRREMHIWILEDYKNEMWSVRIIELPQKLSGDYSSFSDFYPLDFDEDDGFLRFRRNSDGSQVYFNIYSKEERIESPPAGKIFKYQFVPTMLNCGKGIRIRGYNPHWASDQRFG